MFEVGSRMFFLVLAIILLVIGWKTHTHGLSAAQAGESKGLKKIGNKVRSKNIQIGIVLTVLGGLSLTTTVASDGFVELLGWAGAGLAAIGLAVLLGILWLDWSGDRVFNRKTSLMAFAMIPMFIVYGLAVLVAQGPSMVQDGLANMTSSFSEAGEKLGD